MKIKKIRFECHPFFGNAEFDFTDASGNPVDNIVLAGENGCGKTQLLNIIYDFSLLSTGQEVKSEKRTATVVLSPDELQQIGQNLNSSNQLASPTGEFDVTFDFNQNPGFWSRIQVHYQSCSSDGTMRTNSIDASHLFSSTNIKSIFKSIFSTVGINYSPQMTTNVTSKEIDQTISASIKSGDNLASDIQQLFIDIYTNDATELLDWVVKNRDAAPTEDIIQQRIGRFKNAFAHVFSGLNFDKVITKDNKKIVYFQKAGNLVDIASLSSGEKQIVFRGAFLLQNKQSIKGNVALIDEPEISLHPTWQGKIYDYYRMLFTDPKSKRQTSQIFFATHSQYVLRSALENSDNTLIIMLKRTENGIVVQRITAPFVLPTPTSAELNYEAFNIVSNDYHIELYGYLQNKIAQSNGTNECSVKQCDEHIEKAPIYVKTVHCKPSSHGRTHYETLPTYIRNAIDHPDQSRRFTQQELRTSIEFLRELCK